MMHKAWSRIEEVPYCFSRSYVKLQGHTAQKIVDFWGSSIKFQGHTGWNMDDLNPVWVRLLGRSQLSNPSDLPCWLCSHHPIIMKYSGVIINDKSGVHAKGQGQRSKVKVTEVMTPLSRFRTVTPVWIHILRWNDVYKLMLLRWGALLFFKVICQISRSHG